MACLAGFLSLSFADNRGRFGLCRNILEEDLSGNCVDEIASDQYGTLDSKPSWISSIVICLDFSLSRASFSFLRSSVTSLNLFT